ncbi:hypothetical protein OBBRIDRAFT_826393 [Obba rivulosa]|uniref:Uncharacterized protein n=1 Tax=Obba rivulosa TaxID=1052685 RepID=A0A8E2DLA7_9APHY|nr:hypothetical protein OBBRIDRAFT_826393 [Obba rivulosa]
MSGFAASLTGSARSGLTQRRERGDGGLLTAILIQERRFHTWKTSTRRDVTSFHVEGTLPGRLMARRFKPTRQLTHQSPNGSWLTLKDDLRHHKTRLTADAVEPVQAMHADAMQPLLQWIDHCIPNTRSAVFVSRYSIDTDEMLHGRRCTSVQGLKEVGKPTTLGNHVTPSLAEALLASDASEKWRVSVTPEFHESSPGPGDEKGMGQRNIAQQSP